eukprot:CAMPEP_0197445678 /NCGR_PEP_ID=MMETSP1175-20131217/10837_1 /TAXON_ID=1003142 /ORGANISM="Triceratium dubium, Strain CCMP147" /LENGTH=775 /DNA_ID=CAMNT_0042976681 /DNA_START=194 /DNA_END=2518 /DNA_ORIENTATION=+
MPRSQGTSRKGKPKKGERASGMGRALERSQQRRRRPKVKGDGTNADRGMASSGAPSIGLHDDAHAKTMSVLEVDDLTDFLKQSEMAGREFASERERFVVLDDVSSEYKPIVERPSAVKWEDRREEDARERERRERFRFRELAVPRRPAWDSSTTAEELDRREKEYFVEWRRGIAAREEELHAANLGAGGTNVGIFAAAVTPFEKNLEVWRQLWRVLERSDAVVQIVDARNPLFYLSADLRSYAEDDLGKPVLVLVNKSDYLTEKQRGAWSAYLQGRGYDHVFFSAVKEQKKLDEAAREERRRLDEAGGGRDPRLDDEDEDDSKNDLDKEGGEGSANAINESSNDIGVGHPLTRSQLMDSLLRFARRKNLSPSPHNNGKYEFGMVGFPNVGKSSVINVLIGSSKHAHDRARVGVASQPGKTKHFQTLALPDRDDVGLCDCPGLVFPSFVSSTADLIAAGVYPIAQMRDHWSVVELICRRIPREVLNATYGITLPAPSTQDLKERGLASLAEDEATRLPPPTAEELLGTYCVARSLMAAASGVPDYQIAARRIVADYVSGKLLYNHAPPPPSALKEGAEGTAEEESEAAIVLDEAAFRRETLRTALNDVKLRDRLGAAAAAALDEDKDGDDTSDEDGDNTSDDEDDESDNDDEEGSPSTPAAGPEFDDDGIDILDAVGGFADDGGASSGGGGGKRGKSHASVKKWGKKGRKLRNKDPYGCHSEGMSQAELSEMGGGGGGSGVYINAGKYGGAGYTRASYGSSGPGAAGGGGKKSRRR